MPATHGVTETSQRPGCAADFGDRNRFSRAHSVVPILDAGCSAVAIQFNSRALALEDNARKNLKTVKGLGRNYSWRERFGKEFCTHGNG